MKSITVIINTENAAFEEVNEVSRILRFVAEEAHFGQLYDRPLYDINGNKVGEVKVEN